MPHAVTHFLIPAILTALFRDFFIKKSSKKKFPLYYVLIAGLAGLLPDLDIAVYYILGFFGFTIQEIHRTFSHNLFVPLLFLILGFIFLIAKQKGHKFNLSTLFFVLSFGSFIHLVLDAVISGGVMPLYPVSLFTLNWNVIQFLPSQFQETIVPVIDAVLLIFWMIYIEVKHKISDFI